jgi:hypothetical protein
MGKLSVSSHFLVLPDTEQIVNIGARDAGDMAESFHASQMGSAIFAFNAKKHSHRSNVFATI